MNEGIAEEAGRRASGPSCLHERDHGVLVVNLLKWLMRALDLRYARIDNVYIAQMAGLHVSDAVHVLPMQFAAEECLRQILAFLNGDPFFIEYT